MSFELIEKVPFKTWEALSAPVFPDETLICMRAQSALSGQELGQCPPLSIEQARDVLAWFHPKY